MQDDLDRDDEPSEPELDARDELHALTLEALAWAQWLEASGADGAPAGDRTRLGAEPTDEPPRSAAPAPTGRAPDDSAPPAPGRTWAQAAADAAARARSAAPPGGPGSPRVDDADGARDAGAASAPPPTALPRPWAALAPVDRADAVARLAVLEHEVQSCTRCPLHAGRAHPAFARGNQGARVAFVGEGPGAEEDAQGIPFVGAAGQLLDKMIAAMGLGPDEIYICNVVKCRPPGNRKPTGEEMATCAPYLHEQLALVEPELIVGLGATAVQGLLEWYDVGPYGAGITRLRGSWKLYRSKIPLMPTFHPAYLLRSPEKKRDVWNDLQSVMRRLGRPLTGGRSGGARRP